VTRVISGVILLATLGAIAWFAPPQGLLALAVAVAVLAFLELATLADALGAPLPRVPGVLATTAATIGAAWPGASLEPVIAAVVVAAAAMAVSAGNPSRAGVAGVGAAVAAPLYLGLPLGGLAGLRWTDGREAALLVVLAIVASDTCQYYTGRMFGRRRLAPAISPKKTVEGAIGGFVGATLLVSVLGAYWLPGVPPGVRALLGLAIAGLGVVGDLFESVLKRAADMKDSSHLIPGHGGVLDRIDALLLAAPVYVAVLRYGPWRVS
jgi:phosphatidate cytidylyltransferase